MPAPLRALAVRATSVNSNPNRPSTIGRDGRSRSGLRRIEVAAGDVEREHRRIGDVEAGDSARGRQAGEAVAAVAGETAQSLALGAEDKRNARPGHRLVEGFRRLAVEADTSE